MAFEFRAIATVYRQIKEVGFAGGFNSVYQTI